ncbi:hypothetical protein BKA70DRAFT_1213979 [Coprinopsis sp. MPI-PUGE-AT-0042]|nr:hypothetical protein BKA70DRAFT_1213979 [Coprinopsis sp. MPI-PUGE-AT-0042]
MGAYGAILGTLLLGVVVNTYLYGVVSYQYLEYYGSKFKDPARIRWSVLTLLVVDTIYTFLMVYLCWAYLIVNFGNNHLFEVHDLPNLKGLGTIKTIPSLYGTKTLVKARH